MSSLFLLRFKEVLHTEKTPEHHGLLERTAELEAGPPLETMAPRPLTAKESVSPGRRRCFPPPEPTSPLQMTTSLLASLQLSIAVSPPQEPLSPADDFFPLLEQLCFLFLSLLLSLFTL